MSVRQHQEKLARLSLGLRAIVAKAKASDRGLTSSEQEKFHAIEADYTATEAIIKAENRVEEIERDLRVVPADRISATMGDDVYGSEAEKENRRLHNNAFSKYLRHGLEGLNAEEKTFFRMKFRGAQSGSDQERSDAYHHRRRLPNSAGIQRPA